MELQPHDLHFVYSESGKRLKGFTAGHQQILDVECHNSTVNKNTYGHWGSAPLGSFILGQPEKQHSEPFGFWFTAIHDYNGHVEMHRWGRSGIGLHGGGTGLPDPFAPRQGWVNTHGCLRLANEDNAHLVALVKKAQKAGGRCYITISA